MTKETSVNTYHTPKKSKIKTDWIEVGIFIESFGEERCKSIVYEKKERYFWDMFYDNGILNEHAVYTGIDSIFMETFLGFIYFVQRDFI